MGRFVFDPRYAEAILHLRAHFVLRKKLRPFSIWHKLQLEYANSPFLTGGEVTIADLDLAVRICRTSFPNRAEAVKMPFWRQWLWLLWAERVDLRKENRLFRIYLEDYYSAPKLWDPSKKGKAARRDVDESIEEVTLYREATSCSREEPWNLPIGELYWSNLCFARRRGAEIKVFTPADEREFQKHLKWRDKKLAELAQEFAEKEGLSPEEAKKRAHKFYWDQVNRHKKQHGF